MAKPLNADRYLTRRWDYDTPALTYYVRPAGNDNNNGLSPATAFATLDWALHWMSIAEVNQSVVIDITGMTINSNDVLNIGGTTLGGINFNFDLTATSPNNRYLRKHRQIVSDLVLSQALTVTGQSFDATSGILRLTVSNALVANALRDLFAVGSVLGEYGVIQSNTGGAGPNTIEVANIIGLTAPVGAYTTGATLQYGDAGNAFEQAIYLLAMCDWNIQGISIRSNGPKAAAISIWPNAPVSLTLCELRGVEINEGGGTVYIDGCWINGRSFIQDGATASTTQSFFYQNSFLCHGSGASGLNEWVGNIFEACTSGFGGGNIESRYTYQMENCRFTSMAANGALANFGVSRISNSTFNNGGATAIVATNGATIELSNVQGSGNTGFGVQATYGATVKNSNGTAVTGTTNDVSIGAIGATTWASTPATDLDQLVRVGS